MQCNLLVENFEHLLNMSKNGSLSSVNYDIKIVFDIKGTNIGKMYFSHSNSPVSSYIQH